MVLPAGVALRKCLCFWREGASACTHACCERVLKRLRICTAADLRRRTCESGLLMLLSGPALAVHFSLWVEGIENTTITHALFFISVTPILIAAGMWAFGLPISTGESSCTYCPLAPLLAVRGRAQLMCSARQTAPCHWAHHLRGEVTWWLLQVRLQGRA